MTLLDLASPTQALVGNLTAWFLSFHKAEIGAESPATKPEKVFGFDQYHAEITAALPEGFGGGSFSISIEGITDEDYGVIRRGKGELPFAKLYLGWADTNASVRGYLANLLGLSGAFGGVGGKSPPDELLVAVLAIDSVTRRAGSRRYEATIVGRDWIFAHLKKKRTNQKAATGADIPEALDQLLQGTAGLRKGVDYRMHPLDQNPDATPAPAPAKPPAVELAGESSVAEVLLSQEKLMAAATARYGRGLLLLRDGKLEIGARPMPLEGDLKLLTVGGGLIETAKLLPSVANPGAAEDKQGARDQFKLTLKGRPDLKPGDLVSFEPPPEDAPSLQGGLLGALGAVVKGPLLPSLTDSAANDLTLYVASAEHKLGRAVAFVTTVTGVVVTKGHEWDGPPDGASASAKPAQHANAELQAAQAIRDAVRAELQTRGGTEVAEVRSVTESGTGEPPGQTELLWRGLDAIPAHGYSARLGSIRRPSVSPVGGAPYLTPFAFGKCGLVLPRYPGTRVAVIHREGQSNDPIDVGALWPSGQGPDQAKAGDWWLSLPSALDQTKRARIEDSETPADYTGKVTQDLIDADGNRVIEAGEFTIRVGRNVLRAAGERPPRGDTQDAITIEHADGGAQLVLKSDGTIQLKGKNIELDAGSGKITLKASQVDVQ